MSMILTLLSLCLVLAIWTRASRESIDFHPPLRPRAQGLLFMERGEVYFSTQSGSGACAGWLHLGFSRRPRFPLARVVLGMRWWRRRGG
jgi:hypothetical protein